MTNKFLLLAVLVLFLLSPSTIHAQGAGEFVYFEENFTAGSSARWRFSDANGRQIPSGDAWQTEQEAGGDWVLSGQEHNWADLINPGQWDDVRFKTRLRLLAGDFSLNYRINSSSRYFLQISPNRVSLAKQYFPDQFFNDLAVSPAPIKINTWVTVEIAGQGGHIQAWVEGKKVIDYTDPEPIAAGSIAIETYDGSHVHIKEISVTGPAPTPTPTPPPGFEWTFTGGPRGGIGYDIRIDPRNPDLLWVTDANAGVHRSTDGGRTWVSMNNGITRSGFSGDAVPIFSLSIDPVHPDTIWVGTMGLKGVFKTIDGGQTWTKMENGIQDADVMEIRSFSVDSNNPDTVYMGGNYRPDPQKLGERGYIYKTTDGGQSWQQILNPGALVRWILIDPTDHNILYASTGIFDRIAVKPEGIFKSLDAGKTWFASNEGLTSLSVGGLAMSPLNPQVLIATTGKALAFINEDRELYGAVHITTDGGQHWRMVYDNYRESYPRFSAVAFAPSDPNIVYVDAGYIFLRSSNGGETWREMQIIKGSENRGQPIALAVHPDDPNTVFMNAYDGGVFVTHDAGVHWVDSSAGCSGSQSWDVAVSPDDPAFVLVGSKNGVHVSRDGGQTWEGRNTSGYINNILSVAIDPLNPGRFLIGNEIDGWIRETKNSGTTWQQSLPSLGEDKPAGRISIYQIAFAPSQPQTVYAATGIASLTMGVDPTLPGRGLYKSLDGGYSWKPAGPDSEAAAFNILSLAVHPQNPDVVYIGTFDRGVYISTDGGTGWVKAGPGITTNEIRSLAIDPSNPQVVYAGTESSALFRSRDGGKTWQRSAAGMNPESSIRSIVIDPSNPQVLYAADRRSGVYRSSDGGKTWVLINQGLHMRAVNRLAISKDGAVLYAATEGGGVYRMGKPPVIRATTVSTNPPTNPVLPQVSFTPAVPAPAAATLPALLKNPASLIAALALAGIITWLFLRWNKKIGK